MSNYAAIVTVRPLKTAIDTEKLFDGSYVEKEGSPVDLFLDNSLLLNKHWTSLGPTEEIAPEISRLLLIGYLSAVEGYMRSLITRLIHCDPFTRDLCAPHQVSYAAAIHHSKEALPDALLEETSFSTQKVIAPSLKKFVGLENVSVGTRNLLEQFDQIIQLRHCCTHRFGKLGVKNASALGLHAHSKFLEKPVSLNKVSIASIADLTFTLVKSLNNDVFGFVMNRTATGKLPQRGSLGIGWTWHKARDRSMFNKYYDIFCSKKDATPSLEAEAVYDLFREAHRNVGKKPNKVSKK
ncbi:hypothetical protein [Pseudomonas baltica]|uniref:hypothetical protein n=1 Tax=Pseudomonas baltica TaxID=2762576 RepID=UPI0028976512|nr:hypothetical protein [Pseudomonas baltica]